MRNDDFWFTTSRATIRLSNRDNDMGLSLIEHELAPGFSPPLHVHHDEAETFYLIEGRIRFEVDGAVCEAGPGDTLHAAAGSVHSFLVLSEGGARMLTMTHGGFEDMIRASSRPAVGGALPAQVPPTPAQQQMLADAGHRHGIDLIGAPLAA